MCSIFEDNVPLTAKKLMDRTFQKYFVQSKIVESCTIYNILEES